MLGSTGSVGQQAVAVVREHPNEFRVLGLGAGGGQIDLLAHQIVDLQPEIVAIAREEALPDLHTAIRNVIAAQGRKMCDFSAPQYLVGEQAMEELARISCDVVLNAITGAVGLKATLSTLRSGNVLALANKESLILGGEFVTREAYPGQIVPVDSEHSALAQALRGGKETEVKRLIITATGGPFRGMKRAELKNVTIAQALAHPKWSMGPVISINSATMVNKGLEVIEAHLLFNIPYKNIKVVVHPEAYIHSMVEFIDGTTIAQVSPPDMRLPIALGLKWPERIPDVVPGVDWSLAHSWSLQPLDNELGSMVKLARHVGELGGAVPAVYNAANEVCVEAFVTGRLPFLGIFDVVEQVVLKSTPTANISTLEDVLEFEAQARISANELINRKCF
ncbi:MAG TPA: 1-deoxy-D-xylulose-5-phosphate reductoisomerase [Desulfosporosinus sp.]|nr:1-deoxy-D-xylulose-5-phosphate reductoisomerase [Desulfosporosinus sp.]